jgi:putative SOS response-associated peptidase YedK
MQREAYPTGNPLPLSTFTILTTTPHPSISWLHDRMPCVLKTWAEVDRWLDVGEGWKDGKGGTGELLKGVGGLDW